MSRRRTMFHFQSYRLEPGTMLALMFCLWVARVALWLTVALIAATVYCIVSLFEWLGRK